MTSFRDRITKNEAQIGSTKNALAEQREAARKHAQLTYRRVQTEIRGTPHMSVRLNDDTDEEYFYHPSTVQVSFSVKKRGFFSTSEEHHKSLIFQITDRGGSPHFKDSTVLVGDEFTDSEELVMFESGDFGEMLEYVAREYANWKSFWKVD